MSSPPKIIVERALDAAYLIAHGKKPIRSNDVQGADLWIFDDTAEVRQLLAYFNSHPPELEFAVKFAHSLGNERYDQGRRFRGRRR